MFTLIIGYELLIQDILYTLHSHLRHPGIPSITDSDQAHLWADGRHSQRHSPLCIISPGLLWKLVRQPLGQLICSLQCQGQSPPRRFEQCSLVHMECLSARKAGVGANSQTTIT